MQMVELTPSALAGIPFKDLDLEFFLEIETDLGEGKCWDSQVLVRPSSSGWLF